MSKLFWAVLRKTPDRVRSETTVNDLIDAGLACLETQDASTLSPMQVSERAGYSAQTYHNWFPGPKALLRAIARREFENGLAALQDELGRAQGESVETLVGIYVKAILRRFSSNSMVRLRIMKALSSDLSIIQLMAEHYDRGTEALLSAVESHPAFAGPALTPIQRFMMPRAIVGVVRGALVLKPQLLKSPEFASELHALAMGYFSGRLRRAGLPPGGLDREF